MNAEASPCLFACPFLRSGEHSSFLVSKTAGTMSHTLAALLLVAGTATAARPTIPREHAKNVTVYHVQPSNYTRAPVNMNTGDGLGDLYFDLSKVSKPVACANATLANQTYTNCDKSPIVEDVITRVVLEVDDRYFGEYGRCNICINGTDGYGHNNCTDGEYICGCGDFEHPTPCNEKYIGVVNITTYFSFFKKYHSCDYVKPSSNVACWSEHAEETTGGFWYSTLEGGWCDRANATSDFCSWRVADPGKRINKTCSDNSVYSTVEAADTAGCFAGCPSGSGLHRNTSDPELILTTNRLY